MSELTQERLKELLYYDKETGNFIWLQGKAGVSKGKVAGTRTKNSYIQIMVEGTRVLAHRLAFFYTTGVWPVNEVDHINGIKSDNRWENLREATKSQNQANAGSNKNSSLGIKGVIFRDGGYPRYSANVKKGDKRYTKEFSISVYGDKAKELAIDWVTSMRNELHGEFARHE